MITEHLKKDIKEILHRAYIELPKAAWDSFTWFGKCTVAVVVIPMMYILFTFTLFLILFFGALLLLIVNSIYLVFKKEKFS